MTDAEREAIEKDIEAGLKQVIEYIQGVERSLPIAISALNPYATTTRKLLAAFSSLNEARAGLEHVCKQGLVINRKDRK